MRKTDVGLDDPAASLPIEGTTWLETLQSGNRVTGRSVGVEARARASLLGHPRRLKRCTDKLVDNAVQNGESARIRIAAADARARLRAALEALSVALPGYRRQRGWA